MGTLKINTPVIVMDGAALYDIRDNTFREVREIDHADAAFLVSYLAKQGICCTVFAIRNHVQIIFHLGVMSADEMEDYQMMRRSPYRNYVKGSYHEEDQIGVIRFIVADRDADELERRLEANLEVTSRFRISRRHQPRMEGRTGFYFYRKDVSVETTEQHLLRMLEKEEGRQLIPSPILPETKLYTPERDATFLLHKLKRQYERPGLGFFRQLLKQKHH